MANKYDIIHIDFQASARGANAAIESIRKEAQLTSDKITALKKNIEEGVAAKMDNKIIDGMRTELKGLEKRNKQLIQAQNELIKGMRVLDEGVKHFNNGALSQMNAAFQKSVNNAAKLAQSKMTTGTKEWREMGAIMQETEQNYARMQRDTDQLIENLKNGGIVFRKTLEDEKKGLNDLLQVLPYMGTEYRKIEEQLQILVKTTDEMAIKERQMKGEIVTTNDARRVRLQLTKEGAEAARQAASAAQTEIDKGKEQITTLEKERNAIEAKAKASASAAAQYTEDLQMYDDYIALLNKEIDADKRAFKSRKNKAEQLRAEANSAKESADKQREAQRIVDQTYDEAAARVENLKQQLKDLKSGQQQATESTEKQTEAKKEDTAATNQQADATKKQTEGKEEQVRIEESATKAVEKEHLTEEQLNEAIAQQKIELEKLEAEKKAIIEAQQESAKATNAEAEAYKNLTKEQAEAKLKEKQALATFKNEGGKWQVTNREEAQQFLFEALGEIEPSNIGKTKLEINGGSDNINQLLGKFKERYGIQSDNDAMAAIRNLMEGGGMIKGGFMNKFILNLDQNTQKIDSFNNEIKALTDIINSDTKATEKNAEKKRTLEEVEAEISTIEKEKTANVKMLRAIREGDIKMTAEETTKTNENSEAKKKNVEAINAEIEAIRKLNKEQAKAMLDEMRNPSKVDYKAGKLDASNIEEVQSFIVSRMKKIEPRNKKGDQLSLDGEQVTKLIKDIQERYGMIGSPKKAKDLLKQFVQGADGGLFKSGGEADFSGYNKIIVNLDSDAYESRLAKLKELVKITSDTTQATDRLSEATKKGTESSKESTKATDEQSAAIDEQIKKVQQRYDAYQAKEAEFNQKMTELDRKKKAKSNLPKSGPDAGLQRTQLEEEIKDYNENVVAPARRERNKLKKLWESSAQKLVEMQGIEQEAPKNTKKKTQATENDTQATEKNTQATEKNTKAKKDSAKTSEEETQRKQKEAEIKKQLADAENDLTEAKKKQKEEQSKTTRMDREAENLQQKAAEAERNVGGKAEESTKELKETQAKREQLIADNKDTLKNNDENQKQLADINEKLKEQSDRIRENEQIKAQANTQGIEKTEQAIRLLQEENRHIDTNNEQWKKNTADIQALQAALDEMKGKPTLQMMTDRMGDLNKLSNSAFEETKRFWQVMEVGAEKGSAKLTEAQENMKLLIAEERRRNEESAGKVIGDMGSFSDKEIADAVKMFEQMRDSLARTDDKWKEFNEQAQKGTEYLEQMKKQDALEKIEERMSHLSTLSDAAREETKKFFEALKAGAEKDSEDLRKAEDALRDIKNLEKGSNQEKADILLRGTLNNYSESEIREAIEAAKAFRNELATGDKDAERYAEAIAKAEAHIKKYGVETARAAQKQKENDDLMRAQLTRMFSDMYTGAGMPSESQLKAQKQYWQRLIDDPKTAASSLNEYRNALANVEKIEADMVKIGGQTALAWFGQGSDKNASENQIKEMAAKLKEYRGTLLKETNADELAQIDAILQKVGQSAKKAAEDVMSLDDALELAEGAGKDGFLASPQQIHQATKALNDRRDAVIKLIQENKALRLSTEAEEDELADLTKKLRDLKFEQDNYNMSQEKMRLLMETPTKAVNLEELRAAIKRADGELRHMQQSLGENSKQYQEFAEKVKNSKNVLKEMEGQAKANATAWDKAWSRLKTYIGMYMGFNMAWQRITGTVDDLMQLSDKLGEVRKTTGFTTDEVGRLSESLKKMDTRTSITGLLDLSVAAGQLGLKSQQDVEGFTEAANKLMVALPEMGQEGATQMLKIALATGEITKIQRDMDAGLIDGSSATAVAMEKVGSTIDRLRASSAATAPAITDFVKRVGAVGAQSGISIDQVAALGSTVDALGMRVEMSATALSRMIPAIKNNAFAVAKAIGMVPEDLRAMFDEAGGGMNAMIAIFEHIKKQGMGADDIEKLLGMGGMQEIMKELNQQGARAGIVFAGLSQNVETLKAHLLTAAEAYKENTAIQQEYNKMNETTAAKWARLKNQLEEAFVSDSMQRGVGKLIDGLRIIIDLLTGNGGLSTIARGALVYLALFKSKWSEAIGNAILSLGKFIWSMRESAIAAEVDAAAKAADATATEALGDATEDTTEKTNIFTKTWGKMNAALKANIIGAAVTTIVWLASSLWDAHKAAKEAAEAINRVNEKTEEEREAVDSLFAPLKKANLEEAEKKRLITEINSKYGSYLNNMLTEASNAYEIERAYKAINLQLERKNTLEGIETNKKTVMERHKGALDTAYSEMDTAVSKAFFGKKGTDAARVSSLVSTAVRDAIKNGLSADQMSRQIQTALNKEVSAGRMKEYIQIMTGGTSRREDASKYIANAAIRYFNAEQAAQNEVKSTNKRLQNNLDYTIQEIRKAATKDIPELLKTFNNAMSKGTDAKKYSAKESNAVVQAFNAIKGYYDLHQADLTDAQRKKLSKALGTDITTFQSRVEGGGNNNGWGSNHEAASTDWRSMTAEELVARRKQMKDFVNAIQDDSDVERVLKEDAALQKAIAGGLNKNFRSVVEWYNTERLKIQDELYNRHLTNTGEWRDPKKGGGSWRRQLQTDFDNYLRILDAYYTERKAEIEKAQSEEGMSEAEAQRLIIENEIVWRKHRMELQQIYQGKSEQIAKEERQRIYDILAQQDEDTADMVEKTIGKSLGKMKTLATKSEVDFNRVMSRITKSIAADFYKQQHAVSNQVEAIEKIIAQERPIDGLVENLEKNLSTMGILFAELDKKRREIIAAGNEPEDDTHLRGEDATRKRMLVLMQQAESAYTLTFGKLKEVMIKEGFADWAETIENDDQLRKAMMAMLRKMYDDVHAAIKKESTQMKKELDIWWNDVEGDSKLSRKGGFEKILSDLGLAEDQVKRANSLIGAGQASERVADKLAIQQMRVRLAMQNAYYAKLKEIGKLRIKQLQDEEADLRKKGKADEADLKLLDIKHAKQALNLSLSEEQTKVLEQEVAIQNQIEESQNRLYTELKAWGDLLASSMKEIFEASNAGNAEYYNERAKLDLTGKGGPGAGTYIVIDNEGTEDARAHYEYLDEREALERQHEIERQNAEAEAWNKVMDDFNNKMNEQITDWINAMLQNQSIDANTQAVMANTMAIYASMGKAAAETKAETPVESDIYMSEDKIAASMTGMGGEISDADAALEREMFYAQQKMNIDNMVTENKLKDDKEEKASTQSKNKSEVQSTQSTFAKMSLAANMYGAAYQAMSNDNLNATQKFQMIALQGIGSMAMAGLEVLKSEMIADAASKTPGVLGKLWSQLGWAAAPVFAIFTGLLGGLMGLATSKVTKSKAQISQVTGASASAGRLSTGMMTYAEGNVNEFSDPASLTPGRSYNVDAADGKTYRAKYTGTNPGTHLTNGPEFHLAGEKGREMIIDAGTTRQITMNENEIWQAIKTLSSGGRISSSRRRGRGVHAFAEGNVEDFDTAITDNQTADMGFDPAQLQQSIDRQSDLLERALTEGIKGVFDVYGPNGLVASYDKGKKNTTRHGERY